MEYKDVAFPSLSYFKGYINISMCLCTSFLLIRYQWKKILDSNEDWFESRNSRLVSCPMGEERLHPTVTAMLDFFCHMK